MAPAARGYLHTPLCGPPGAIENKRDSSWLPSRRLSLFLTVFYGLWPHFGHAAD